MDKATESKLCPLCGSVMTGVHFHESIHEYCCCEDCGCITRWMASVNKWIVVGNLCRDLETYQYMSSRQSEGDPLDHRGTTIRLPVWRTNDRDDDIPF